MASTMQSSPQAAGHTFTSDVGVRYHVNGAQFIDERVATFDDSMGEFSYYFVNQNYSVAGTGNADGSVIERVEYSATGDFTPPPDGYFFDADSDTDIDLADLADFISCLLGPDVDAGAACAVHDIDRDTDVDLFDATAFARGFTGAGVSPPDTTLLRSGSYAHDGDGDRDIDLDDYSLFLSCLGSTDPGCLAVHDYDASGESNGQVQMEDEQGFQVCFADPTGCFRDGFTGSAPASGTFALHGRPVDVLSDGHIVQYSRARYYAPAHSRWLQRDPTGYTDGGNLYEAFRANATRFTDPMGTQAVDEHYYAQKSKRAAEYARYLLDAIQETRYLISELPPLGAANKVREAHVANAFRLRMELENLVRGSELGEPGYLDLNDPENYALVQELQHRGIANAHILAGTHRYERAQVQALKEGAGIVAGEALSAFGALRFADDALAAGRASATAAWGAGSPINPRYRKILTAWESYSDRGGTMTFRQWLPRGYRHYGKGVLDEPSGFAAWSRKISGTQISKNSRLYQGPTHVYRIDSSEGLWRIGESAQGTRHGLSIRAEEQVRALQRETGLRYKSRICKEFLNKADALDYERMLIQRYSRRFGRPPGNPVDR